MNYIKNLTWRYATKKFDATKKLSGEQLDILFETARLAPSSFGLQPYEIIHIKNPKTRDLLKNNAFEQTQVNEASDFIVIAIRTDLNEEFVNEYIELVAKTRGITVESLSEYKQMMVNFLNNLNQEQKIAWAHKQAYIVLGFLLDAAAQNQIDSCPMEGYDSKAFDEILNLKEQNLTSSVCVALGYRDSNDSYAILTKVRKEKENFIIEVK